MIVAFARRSSTDSSSRHSDDGITYADGRKNSRRSLAPNYPRSRKPADPPGHKSEQPQQQPRARRPSRKQTLPTPIIDDPVDAMTHRRITDMNVAKSGGGRRALSVSLREGKERHTRHSSYGDVLVDFPDRSSRSHRMSTRVERSKSMVVPVDSVTFKKQSAREEIRTDEHLPSDNNRPENEPPKQPKQPSRRHKQKSSGFSEVDWRNTSIDWGDDDDDEIEDNFLPEKVVVKHGRKKKQSSSRLHNSFPRGSEFTDSTTSLTASLTSLLSMRKAVDSKAM